MARIAAGEPDVAKLSSGIRETNKGQVTRNLGELFREAKARNNVTARKKGKDKYGCGIYRVSKYYHNRYKQGYAWRYTYKGKKKKYDFVSTDILELKAKVLFQHLMWRVYDDELAHKTAEEAGVNYNQLI